MTKTRKVAVGWTQAEKEFIAKESLAIMRQQKVSKLKAVQQANAMLPPHRQRAIHILQDVKPWIITLWEGKAIAEEPPVKITKNITWSPAEREQVKAAAWEAYKQTGSKSKALAIANEKLPKDRQRDVSDIYPFAWIFEAEATGSPRKTRVVWTDAEKKFIAEQAFKYARQDGMSALEAVKTANLLLPIHRRHEVRQQRDIAWLPTYWDLLYRQQANAPAIHPVSIPEEPATAAVPEPSEMTFDALWSELGRRLNRSIEASTIRAFIREEVQSVLAASIPGFVSVEPPKKHQPEIKAEPAPIKRKIVVIGLLDAQEKMMRAEFPNFDFLFLDKTPSLQKCKSLSPNVSHIIQTKWSAQIKGAAQISNFRRVGGLTHLRQFLSNTK